LSETLDASLSALIVEPDRVARHVPDVLQRAAGLFAVTVPDQVA
jgi:hypothetical protein